MIHTFQDTIQQAAFQVLRAANCFTASRRTSFQSWRVISVGSLLYKCCYASGEAMNRTLSLPEELLQKAEALAAREHLPLEEYLSATLSEHLKQRADRASDEKFRAALRTIPDAEPEESDRS